MTDRIDESPPMMSIPEQAAEWLLRWHCGDLSIADRYEYLQWLKTSPVHIAEMLRMCRLYSWLDSAKLKLFVTNEDTFSNVVELASPPRGKTVKERKANRANVWKASIAAGAAAICLSAVLAFAAKLVWFDHTLQTVASEFRTVPLSDGSSIVAAPYTSLHHDIGDQQRLISLEEGKAVFRVAKDKSRPFFVEAGRVLVKATGTKFTVERHGSDVSVTMHEGSVVVAPSAGSEGTFQVASLAADDQWTLSGAEEPNFDHVDGKKELDWSYGRLEFGVGDTVGEAAAEFNQYNATKIIVDKATGGRQMRGAFDANDPLSFAYSVRQSTGAAVVQETADLVFIGPRDSHRH
jgi:transmembrane sensor